jgi:molybdopterin-guanine dinucleotide biosynthesis protein A
MGRFKQFVDLGGQTMIEKIVGDFSDEVDEVVLIGDGPIPAGLDGLDRVADSHACRGPMAGILGALHARPGACWVIVPCDVPLLQPAAIRWLARARRDGAVAVLPSIGGFVEPLLALYEADARNLLEEAAINGDHALHRLAADPRVSTAEPPESLKRCWFNANTPQELLSLWAG